MATRPRDRSLETVLTRAAVDENLDAAARALSAFADERALPGGVRIDLDADLEAAEELADARNYLVWGVMSSTAVGDDHARLRRHQALGHVVAAYRVLRGDT